MRVPPKKGHPASGLAFWPFLATYVGPAKARIPRTCFPKQKSSRKAPHGLGPLASIPFPSQDATPGARRAVRFLPDMAPNRTQFAEQAKSGWTFGGCSLTRCCWFDVRPAQHDAFACAHICCGCFCFSTCFDRGAQTGLLSMRTENSGLNHRARRQSQLLQTPCSRDLAHVGRNPKETHGNQRKPKQTKGNQKKPTQASALAGLIMLERLAPQPWQCERASTARKRNRNLPFDPTRSGALGMGKRPDWRTQHFSERNHHRVENRFGVGGIPLILMMLRCSALIRN